jgi:hypothetical protein
MKTKRHRIFGCLLLICAFGLAVGICTSVANSKTPLSDNALNSIYGGCGDCLADGEGCPGPAGTQCGSLGEYSCNGRAWRQGCRQTKKSCQGTNPSSCVDTTEECDGTYEYYKCEWKEEFNYCGVKSQQTYSCSQWSKAWCT